MISGLHTDPEHHTYGARGLVAGPRIVSPETPVRSRSCAPNEFTEPHDMIVVGPQFNCASVAQQVERRPEESGVGGSIPSRGTKRKV